MVEHVVDGHRAEQVPRAVDDRARHQVVGREVAGDPGERRVRGQRRQLVVQHPGDQLERGLPQQPLGVHAAEVAAGRGLGRGAADEHHARQRGRDVGVADPGQRLGDRGVGAQDDRFRGHQAARGVGRVAQQPPHRRRTPRAPSAPAAASASASGSSASRSAASSGAIASSTSAARSRRRGAPSSSRWSVSDSSSNTSASRSSSRPSIDLVAALLGQLGAACRRRRRGASSRTRPAARRCPAGRERQPGDGAPRHDLHLGPRRANPCRRGAHREPPDHPVAGAGGLDRGVDDDHFLAASRPADRGVEQLADDAASRSARWAKRRRLTDPVASVIGAGVDGGDPQHRHEDPPPGGELDDEPEHARRVGVDAHGGHDVAHLADALAVGPEDGETHQACDEDAGCGHPEERSAERPGDHSTRCVHRIRHPPVTIVR